MDDFFDIVARSFAFLVDEYGFALTSSRRESSLDSIQYEKRPIIIELSWYKGETDIIFRIDLENEIFRPYVSRIFTLREIALRHDRDAYRNAPRFPNYITTYDEAEAVIRFEARVMRKCCKEILRGDIRILEEITQERKTGRH